MGAVNNVPVISRDGKKLFVDNRKVPRTAFGRYLLTGKYRMLLGLYRKWNDFEEKLAPLAARGLLSGGTDDAQKAWADELVASLVILGIEHNGLREGHLELVKKILEMGKVTSREARNALLAFCPSERPRD